MPGPEPTPSILLLGRLPFDLASLGRQVDLDRFDVHTGTSLDEARAVLAEHPIEMVIMGAGLPLDVRLAVVEHVFSVSDSTTVHMKDRASGRSGFVPFLRTLLESTRRSTAAAEG